LQSFAYVDFSNISNTFLKDFFNVASKHGMIMPSEQLVHECKVQANNGHLNNGTGRIVGMVEDAIKRARSVFLHDSTGYFLQRNIHFRTRVENPGGFHSECLVLEMLTEYNEVALMLPKGDYPYSHDIIVDGIKKPARKW
jgi:hypothetical protein